MGEFSPPFSEPPSSFFFSYPSNIETIFDFSDIITKIHPHFKILDPPLYSSIPYHNRSSIKSRCGSLPDVHICSPDSFL